MNVIISGAVKICPDLNLGNQHQPGHLVTLVSVSQSEASIEGDGPMRGQGGDPGPCVRVRPVLVSPCPHPNDPTVHISL